MCAITRKTVGYADVIRQSLEPIRESIDFAFIYGSIAKATDTARSDTDLMIIGNDLAYADIMNLLIPAETELQRAINPSIYLLSDFNDKLQQVSRKQFFNTHFATRKNHCHGKRKCH
jgi:predicted nucleotidyltransferase